MNEQKLQKRVIVIALLWFLNGALSILVGINWFLMVANILMVASIILLSKFFIGGQKNSI